MGLPIKGAIKETGFIQLLKEVAESRLTGMIRVEKGPIIKVVYVQQGTIAFASSNEKSDRLTEVLKRAGKLTTEQIDDAQARLKPNVSLGKTLVELGYISAKDLLWGARSQVEGILHQLLFWKEGNYQILEGPLPKEIVSLGLPISHVLYDGVQKTQDRDWVLEQIVSPQAVYELTADFHEKFAAMKLPAEPVVSRINGKRPLEDIAQNAGMDTFEVCKTVAALQLLGLTRRVQDQALQMPLLVAQNQSEQALEAGGVEEAESGTLSLGQVLQIPTVEELQEEPEEEEAASTLVSVPPLPAERQVAKTEESVSPAEPAASETAEAAEEAEAPISFLESSSVKELPVERIPHPTFGSIKSHRARGPRSEINWRNLALWMALVAVLALGAMKLYFRSESAASMNELSKLTAPIKAPKKVTHAPAQTSNPISAQPVANEQPVSQPLKQPSAATQQPPTATQQPAAANKQPAQAQIPPALQAPTQKPPEQATATAITPLRLLQDGRLADAAIAWQKELTRARSKYTIQLELACQESTVREAAALVDSSNLLVVPINYHGQSCYRILYGTYSTQSSAEAARAGLPAIFLKQEAPARVVPVSKLLP